MEFKGVKVKGRNEKLREKTVTNNDRNRSESAYQRKNDGARSLKQRGETRKVKFTNEVGKMENKNLNTMKKNGYKMY